MIGVAVFAALWIVTIGVLLVAGRRSVAVSLVRLLPDLVRLFRGLLRDPRVPKGAKVAVAIGVVWLVSPIDLIPEFVPVLGPLDDALVAALVLRMLVRRTSPAIIREHWRGDEATLRMLLRLGGVRSDVGPADLHDDGAANPGA